MSKIKFNELVDISVFRVEASFDRASDEAYRIAIRKFGIDDCGHSDNVESWVRTSCSIVMTFHSYFRSGNAHTYVFKAHATKSEE